MHSMQNMGGGLRCRICLKDMQNIHSMHSMQNIQTYIALDMHSMHSMQNMGGGGPAVQWGFFFSWGQVSN